MPRLRDTRTDVVVNVDDATASALGAAYVPVEEVKKAPVKKAASSKSDTK
ncbi:MAG: hypothetical protein ABWX92_12995 [Mycetocola sp.]